MPKLREVRRDEWEAFEMSKESALVLRTSEEGSDYFLNMDNQYLLIELKSIRDNNKIALTNARYKYSMALIGMGVESYYKAHKDEDTDVAERVGEITQMIAPILIPMIESMSDLDLNEI